MIQEALINPLKHRSDKRVVNNIYSKFSRDIHSLICQTGNLYEVVLERNFSKVLKFVEEFAAKESENVNALIYGDGFSMIFLSQIGSSEREIVSINSKFLTIELENNGKTKTYHLVQLTGTKRIDVYMDFVYLDVLIKRSGSWCISGLEKLAQEIGAKLEQEPMFINGEFEVD